MYAATLFLLTGLPAAALPDPVSVAARDIVRLSPDQQIYTRYFVRRGVLPKRQDDFLAGLKYHWNSLSREADFADLYVVGDEVLRVDLRDIGVDRKTFEKLLDDEPYYHVLLRDQQVVVGGIPEVGDTVRAARSIVNKKDEREVLAHAGDEFVVRAVSGNLVEVRLRTGELADLPADALLRVQRKQDKDTSAQAPWLPPEDIKVLVALTQSQIPIVRADWFLVYTSQNVDRKAGYYVFLGIKNEKDILDLGGIDVERARRRQRELLAIIERSGVALNNRQVLRLGEPGYWKTLDPRTSRGRQNARVQLNGDFDFDASEVYFQLPNYLWGYAAVQAKDVGQTKAGTLQDSVPDFIASDKENTSNDGRIHPMRSCVGCHIEGLRPLNDYGRKFYSVDAKFGGALLTSPDYERVKRLKRLYLGPLQEAYDADQLVYQKALIRLLGAGWTPQRIARTHARIVDEYAETPVSGTQLAVELGCTQEEMLRAFEKVALVKGANVDPVLEGYLRKPKEFTARREHVEEAWPVLALAVKGLSP
jgi:hypothetical protein